MKKIIYPLMVIVIASFIRLLPHVPNFSSIAAMALLGGVYFSKKYALIIPVIALFISDIFLGFHSTIPFVYGSFLITGLIGLWLKKHQNFKSILFGTLLSSVLFFLITNFGVWLVGSLYQKNITGLAQSYFMAIPFFRNSLIGDLFFTGVFFGSYYTLFNSKKALFFRR
jgi:uncharacterized membrane protein